MNQVANNYDVVIVGAGPAGSSAAIQMAQKGVRVLLIEQKRFPRPKLCGEFISPECLVHFEKLGVDSRMKSAGAAFLRQTVFYSAGGRSVAVPTRWFGFGGNALGLSRAEMDNRLLTRAEEVGVEIQTGVQASAVAHTRKLDAIRLRDINGQQIGTVRAPVCLDATGRTRAISFAVAGEKRGKAPFVAFKAHLAGARVEDKTCEIYVYPGGYGGLTQIEGGLSNLCFIVSGKVVRRLDSNPERVLREVVCQNPRAALTLETARVQTEWLSVALASFGRYEVAPSDGLLAIGDAASFIDPFSGSGMLMALESGELAAELVAEYLQVHPNSRNWPSLAHQYRETYRRRFQSRLRVCSVLRRAAFMPRLAELAISLTRESTHLRRWLAQATRNSYQNPASPNT